MVQLMEQLAPVEGYNISALDDVRFLRSNRPLTRTPVLYDPGIVILCQGRKRGYLGNEVYVYDARHYLVVSVPVPFTMETDASADEPMLAVYFHLDFKLAGELMLQVDEIQASSRAQPKGMYSSPMDDLLSESTLRFLEAMSNPAEAKILGPHHHRRAGRIDARSTEPSGALWQGDSGHSQDPQQLSAASGRGVSRPRGENERAELPSALSPCHRLFAHAVLEVDPIASGAFTDAAQRHDSVHRSVQCGL
jgi:hypothetical protein